MTYPDGFAAYFWARVQKSGDDDDDCWPWLLDTQAGGYGQLQRRGVSQQPLLAHRVAWELCYGPIPAGQHVLHRCDNPPCCRPSHLFLGTQVDNANDRHAKGRTASGDANGARTKPERNPFVRNRGSGLRGAQHPRAKLTDAAVTQIRLRAAAGERHHALGREYGVSQTHIKRLVDGVNRKENDRASAVLSKQELQASDTGSDRESE